MPLPGIVANRFGVTIDTIEIASFSELTGIYSEVEPVDLYHTNGQGPPQIAKLPGKFKPPTIVLKKGSDETMKLWQWHRALREGHMKEATKTGSITMYAPSYSGGAEETVAIYHFHNAWCTKITLSGSKAGGSEVLMEEVTIVCEDLHREK